MAPLSEIIVTPDMMRRHRLADIAPRLGRNLCGMVAAVLCGVGLSLAGIVLTSQSLGG